METPPNTPEKGAQTTSPLLNWKWTIVTLLWFAVLGFFREPRPVPTPEWVAKVISVMMGGDSPGALALTILGMRILSNMVLGALVMFSINTRGWNRRSLLGLLAALTLGIFATWITFGHFPIRLQIIIISITTALGALYGLALKMNLRAAIMAVALTVGLCAWGFSTGISDELDTATRATARHLLDNAVDIASGDEGFIQLFETAFASAEKLRPEDPVLANRSAILALSVILGEEKVTKVAHRHVDPARIPQMRALRKRITVQGRRDWPRHFWLSAGLTLLSGNDRSMAVGIAKELMDAQPGGSGFSFTDLAADAAGNRFTLAATRDPESARFIQERIRKGIAAEDIVPELRDLPEGITQDEFREQYGGISGKETQRIADEIRRRLGGCALLK